MQHEPGRRRTGSIRRLGRARRHHGRAPVQQPQVGAFAANVHRIIQQAYSKCKENQAPQPHTPTCVLNTSSYPSVALQASTWLITTTWVEQGWGARQAGRQALLSDSGAVVQETAGQGRGGQGPS